MATNNPAENPTLRQISSYLYPPDRRGTQQRVLREQRATCLSAVPARRNHLTFSIAGENSPYHKQLPRSCETAFWEVASDITCYQAARTARLGYSGSVRLICSNSTGITRIGRH